MRSDQQNILLCGFHDAAICGPKNVLKGVSYPTEISTEAVMSSMSVEGVPIVGQVVDAAANPVPGASITEYLTAWTTGGSDEVKTPTLTGPRPNSSATWELNSTQADNRGKFRLDEEWTLGAERGSLVLAEGISADISVAEYINEVNFSNGLVTVLATKETTEEAVADGPWFGTTRAFLKDVKDAPESGLSRDIRMDKRSVFDEDVGPGKLDLTVWYQVRSEESKEFDIFIEARNGQLFGRDTMPAANAFSSYSYLRRGTLAVTIPESIEAESKRRNRWERVVPLRTTAEQPQTVASLSTSYSLPRNIPPHAFHYGWGYSQIPRCQKIISEEDDTEPNYTFWANTLLGVLGEKYDTVGVVLDLATIAESTMKVSEALVREREDYEPPPVTVQTGQIGADTTRTPNPNRTESISMSWRQPLTHALYRLPIALPQEAGTIELIASGTLHLLPPTDVDLDDEWEIEAEIVQLGHPFELDPNATTPQ